MSMATFILSAFIDYSLPLVVPFGIGHPCDKIHGWPTNEWPKPTLQCDKSCGGKAMHLLFGLLHRHPKYLLCTSACEWGSAVFSCGETAYSYHVSNFAIINLCFLTNLYYTHHYPAWVCIYFNTRVLLQMQRLEEQQTLWKLGLPFKDSESEFLVRLLPNYVLALLHFSLFPYVAIWSTLHHIVTNLEVI
jgi:hypothetical protein